MNSYREITHDHIFAVFDPSHGEAREKYVNICADAKVSEPVSNQEKCHSVPYNVADFE